MAGNFKIPEEMAPGEIKDRVKVFTQTVRAKHPDVKEIPEIELPYFNTETGKYEVARSDAIPLSVLETGDAMLELLFDFGNKGIGSLNGLIHIFDQTVNFSFERGKLRPQRTDSLSIEVVLEEQDIIPKGT